LIINKSKYIAAYIYGGSVTDGLKAKIKQYQSHITIKEMAESTCYNKLEQESKLVQNIIKVIG
jgi:hypothetical protein